MARLTLNVSIEQLHLSAPFRISGFVFEHQPVVLVTLRDGALVGRGEASGVYYLGDTADGMRTTIEAQRERIEAGIDREALQQLLPAGGARNALDCALWELEAARAGRPVWQLAGLPALHPLVTTFTLGADSPGVMAAGAKKYAQARCIKVKLTGELELDLARIRAIRAARPDVWMGVDANQGYAIQTLPGLIEELVRSSVSLLEQPLKRGREADLEGLSCPIPVAADESALTLADLPTLVGRFNIVNIKLDKCGGLTEGLAMATRARELGLGVMVGNMVGTSLAMAPGCVVGQYCDVVDLDGPIFLAQDRKPSARYHEGKIWCAEDVWGGAEPAAA
jgi:L-alanine-DL-glutamate epimerase-like enolase superfamily enzyme